MEWLNYHHLLYFWMAVREGSITRASQQLRLAQPTVSGQIRQLERAFGEQLLTRAGRHVTLTESGRIVYRYAQSIFGLGQELLQTMKGHEPQRTIRFVVGLAEVFPKVMAYWLLRSALSLPRPVHLICREARLEQLLNDLALHVLDVVFADTPVPPTIKMQAFSHLLGESPVMLFATDRLAHRYRRDFPRCLSGAPFLLPTQGSALRRSFDDWFAELNVRPRIVGEFDDMATLLAFGRAGGGIFPASAAMKREVTSQYTVRVVSQVDAIRLRFYAITVARRIEHPAMVALLHSAQKKLSGTVGPTIHRDASRNQQDDKRST